MRTSLCMKEGGAGVSARVHSTDIIRASVDALCRDDTSN